jgi:Xaa-Pro aminopeptidase
MTLQPHDLARRLAALRSALAAQDLAGAILSRPEHVFYFTGRRPGASPAFLLVLPERCLAVAPTALGGCDTVTYSDYDIQRGWSVSGNAAAALGAAVADCDLSHARIGVELEHLPALYAHTVRPQIGRPSDVAALLAQLRQSKDAAELAQIESNLAANDRAFGAVQAALRPGITELELWAIVHRTLCEAAGTPVVLEADLGAGLRASNPDVKPSNAAIQVGEAVLVDIYACSHSYYADTTRVFVMGTPDAKQRAVHAVLEEALAAGEAALRPGGEGRQVDAAVRGVIEHAGFGPNFPHHSGHAYGLFQQEHPYLIPAEAQQLAPGMVVTLEPGIYSAGWGGMRLEGNYVITAGGARRLDRFPSQLTSC